MKKARLSLLTVMVILLHAITLSAQQFLWGVRGGSSQDLAGTLTDERVYDITTDVNGNVYALSAITASSSSYLGQTVLPTYASPTVPAVNLLVTSYSCTGTLRWKKLIGGDASCTAKSIRTDGKGHVYVMGHVSTVSYSPGNPPVKMHFDADTTLPYDLYKTIFITQYDTSGNYKWLRMPQADTVSPNTYYRSSGYDMAVDHSGNLNVVTFLTAGSLPGTNFTITGSGLYILKYNDQGALIAATQPPGFNFATITSGALAGYPDVAFESFRMAQSANGNWIISGSQSPYAGVLGFTIGGQLVNHPGFVASFNSQWQHLWHNVADDDITRYSDHPVTDADNNVYVTGIVPDGNQLFGETIQTDATGGIPFVVRLNSSGNKVWLSYASNNQVSSGGCHSTTVGQAITMTSGGDLALTGGCGGLQWGNVQIPGICNTGYNAFIARLSSVTGAALDIDTIPKGGNGNFVPGGNFGLVIAAGKNNNVYIGGKMSYGHVAGTSVMNFIGGDMDFFLAKYGYNCDCVMPASMFTKSITGNTVNLSYTGTVTGIDSVVWNFDDGQTLTRTGSAISTPFNHIYTSGGAHNICATAYSSCGSNQNCQSIQTGNGNGITTTTGLPEGIKVYPNPANDYFVIEGAASAHLQLINIVGQRAVSGFIKDKIYRISTANLPAGNYILVISTANGIKGSMMITKR